MAMADYSKYLKLQQATSGQWLANAYYGRAVCLAKLGNHAHALRDINECIRVGPVDEQVTDTNASLVPKAKVAKMILLQACPELAGKQDEDQRATTHTHACDVDKTRTCTATCATRDREARSRVVRW